MAPLAFGLTATFGTAPAAADGLGQALSEAYRTSPILAGAREQLRATDEGVPIAKANARLQVSGTVGVTQSTNGITNFQNGGRVLTGGLNLSYPLFQGGRVKNAINAAESRVIAGRADLRTTEGNFFTEAVQAYMDVLLGQSVVELNAGNVRVLETNLRASRDRFQVGDLTRTDVAQSEARLSIAHSQLSTAQGNLVRARESYRRIIGSWPAHLDAPPPLPKLPATPDQAVDIAIANSPAISSAVAGTEAARYDVRTAQAGRMPTVALNGGTNYNNYLGTRAQASGFPASENGLFDQSYSQNQAGVSLTLPLYQGGGVSAKVRQAQALRNASEEQGIDIERQVIANARAAFAAFAAAGEAITANEQAVSANRLALDGTRAENSVGQRTVIEVLNAEQEYLNAQVQLVTAQHDRYVAGFALLNAMGQAEASHLNLEGGAALYDPVMNYKQVRNRFGDWSDDRHYRTQSTHTNGPTPVDADTQPFDPDPRLGAPAFPAPPGSLVPNPGSASIGVTHP